ncbi:MAG TPA: hypothetical protein VHE55_06035 [Fimbriimonadaceae bacterium]|nr:hypothetical protein [Fimbriimonadaceae bacterium]
MSKSKRNPFQMQWTQSRDEAGVDYKLLEVLVTNPHSPFFERSAEEVARLFDNCGAEYAETPMYSATENPAEGVVVYRQYKEQIHLYIPLTGVLVEFEAKPSSGPNDDPNRGMKLDFPITMDKLYDGFDYVTSIPSGQATGLVGFFTSFLRVSRHYNIPEIFTARKLALAETHLVDLAGRWNLSGFVSNHSKVARIKIERILEFLLAPREDAEETARRNAYLRMIVRRCCEESTLRYSQSLLRTSLLARNRRDQVWAIHLCDYHQQTHKSYVIGTNKKLAWYLGLHNDDLIPEILRQFPKGVIYRTPGMPKKISFDPDLLMKYSREYLKALL